MGQNSSFLSKNVIASDGYLTLVCKKTIVFFCLFFLFCQPISAMHRSFEKPIGVRTFTYLDPLRNRPIVVEVWYPASQNRPLDEVSDSIWTHPTEVRDSPVRKGVSKYPLILMSHGHQGGRRDMSWLASWLVHEGFVVASVDHYGDMRTHFDLSTSVRFWHRALDFPFVLDQLQKNRAIENQIDFTRVGFVGYSLGGMTGLSLAGAQAKNVREVLSRQRKELTSEFLDRIDFSEAERSFADPRIQSMVLLCPATFVYPFGSLSKIKIPIGLVAAIKDEVLPFEEHALQILLQLVPAKLKLMRKEISHYAFMNHMSEPGKKNFQKAFPSELFWHDRASIHQEVGNFVVSFFQDAFKTRNSP